MKLISIEGNIGSGKSTLLNRFRKYVEDHEIKNVIFIDEPVEVWNEIVDENGTPMLTLFYRNQKMEGFAFQMMAYITRLRAQKEIVKKYAGTDMIIISERSLQTDKEVFAKMLYADGKIEKHHYTIYTKWFDCFLDDIEITHRIYIKTDPDKCLERVNKRDRAGEGSIPLEYLKSCHDYHDKMIEGFEASSILAIDGNVDIADDQEGRSVVENWIEQIFAHVN